MGSICDHNARSTSVTPSRETPDEMHPDAMQNMGMRSHSSEGSDGDGHGGGHGGEHGYLMVSGRCGHGETVADLDREDGLLDRDRDGYGDEGPARRGNPGMAQTLETLLRDERFAYTDFLPA